MADLPRIVHVARPASEELAAHITGLTAGLAGRRNEPFVVGPLDRRLREDLSGRNVRWANLPLPGSLKPGEQREAAGALSRLLGNLRPVVIHAHGFQACLTTQLARRHLPHPPPPLVLTPHGVPALHGHGRAGRFLRRVGYRRVLGECDAVIIPSEAERRALQDAGLLVRVAADSIHVVHPGVERRRRSSVFDVGIKRRRMGLHQDAAVVVLMSPLEPGLHLEDFLRAAALVSEETANVDFAVLGEGSLADELPALAHSLGLSGNTVFLGRRPDALDIMATCNVMVALSDTEGAVVQALEALAQDLRLVANDLSGLREFFAGVEGIQMVPVTDHRAFADAIHVQLEGVSDEGDVIRANTDINWSINEVLASQDEFDLDKPGLDPHDRSLGATSDVDRLLQFHTADRMVQDVLNVYRSVLAAAPE